MSNGQQSGRSFEQPAHGYSRTPPPSIVTMAYSGEVQLPVKMAFPVKVATGPSVGKKTADCSVPVYEEAAVL